MHRSAALEWRSYCCAPRRTSSRSVICAAGGAKNLLSPGADVTPVVFMI